MNFNMNISKIALTSALLLSASAFAAENQEVVKQQKSLLEKLDSLNAAVLGLKLNGTAKAGVLASMASSDQFAEGAPTQENQAYTDVNLKVTARPSAETMVDVQLRLHKDWQNAYDENNNPVIGHWFSYDGTILNKHVNFNLGDMRVGYTPLTIFTPQPELLQEPEIFSEKRVEALARRNLDTTSRRLMSGLNVEYTSGSVGALDNITAQLTGARMRNTAKKIDQVFFDFDFSDRYLLGARVAAEAFGARLGANFVEVSDRKLSRRSRNITTEDTVYYDDNRVISAELGFNSNKLMPQLPVAFGLNVEFAMSNWKYDRDYMVKGFKESYKLTETLVDNAQSGKDTVVYVAVSTSNPEEVVNEKLSDEDGKALHAELFVNGDISGVEFNFSGMFLQNDKEFWSEMASSPTYQGGSIVLNANALYGNPIDNAIMSSFGSSSLENLYFNVYNSTTLNATNLMTSGSTNTLSNQGESPYLYSRLDNNYKNGHFYRNGYTAAVSKKMELNRILSTIDPTVGLALPYGLATPNRKGVAIKLDAKWNDAISFNGRFNMLTETDAIDAATGAIGDNKYTEFAVGVGVDAGRLAKLDREILVQGSFANSKEDSYWKRSTTRILAGLTAEVWGPVSLLAGFQQLDKKFDTPFALGFASITEAKETLLLAGVRVKIAAGAFATLQYGMLKNELDYISNGVASKLSIDKNVIAGDVTVNF